MTKSIPTQVHSLLRHSDVDLALICLGSLLKFSLDPLRLVIHDDGSLTREDERRICKQLPGARVIFRAEADALVIPLLARYPNAQRFRRDDIYSLKFLDVPLLSEGDIAVCDSDILFFRNFSGLFSWPDAKTSALFMADLVDDAYNVYPWHLLGKNALQLVGKANVGLIYLKRKAYDLDFVDRFLSYKEHYKIPIALWTEQTCWAALGYRSGCRLWHPEQILMMRPDVEITDEAVAGHFVGRYRRRFEKFLIHPEQHVKAGRDSVVVIKTIAAQRCSALQLAISMLRRKLINMHELSSRGNNAG